MAAARLRRAGYRDLVILELAAYVGGVWRAAALGVTSAATGLLGVGCQSVGPTPEPPLVSDTALYPGLPPTAAAPVILPGATAAPPAHRTIAPAAVSVLPTGRTRTAARGCNRAPAIADRVRFASWRPA